MSLVLSLLTGTCTPVQPAEYKLTVVCQIIGCSMESIPFQSSCTSAEAFTSMQTGEDITGVTSTQDQPEEYTCQVVRS